MPPKKSKLPVDENSEPVEKPLNTANAVLKHCGISITELKEILEEIYQASLEDDANQAS